MKILFLSHEATLTGAPLVLLNLLKWLKANKANMDLNLLHLEGGERLEEFDKQVNRSWVKSFHYNAHSKFFFLIRALLSKIGIHMKTNWEKCEDVILSLNPEMIYSNTIVCVPDAVALKNKLQNSKLIVHVHELPVIINSYITEFHKYDIDIDGYIAASNLVKNSLIAAYGISPSKIEVIYEFVNSLEKLPEAIKLKDEFRVGASGVVLLRKGFDIFILIAKAFKKRFPKEKVTFEWVGKYDKNHKMIIDSDLTKLDITDTVHFSGQTSTPIERFAQWDLFLMVSREDPFPLVCIEVAQLGKPIICFEQASGIVEMLSSGGGQVVPYFDVDTVVEKIYYYYKNNDSYETDANILKDESYKYLTEHQAPKVFEYIKYIGAS